MQPSDGNDYLLSLNAASSISLRRVGQRPSAIRKGLEGLDEPVLGLTVGLAAALIVHWLGLSVAGLWKRPAPPRMAYRWMLAASPRSCSTQNKSD